MSQQGGNCMSGRKCSTISYDAAREQKRELLSQIDVQRRTVEGIRQQVVEALSGATPGLREHFAAESESAQRWIEASDALVSTSQPLSPNSSLSDVSQQAREYRDIVMEGSRIQEHLQEAFIKRAGALRAEGARQIFAIESLLGGAQGLIASWFGHEEVDRARDLVRELHRHFEQDRIGDVSRLASSMQRDVNAKLQSAEANESKYQRRLYVLKALRQVCAEMGFKEVASPQAERPGDRKSRIILKVDTFNRGEVTFYLSLEFIEADSCISQTHCFEEFGQLSDHLAGTFGVMTKFQMEDGESAPKLVRKGELEERTGTDRTAESES
jgi:hypothetical protein